MGEEKQFEEFREISDILTEAAHMACEDIPLMPYDESVCLSIPCHRCKEARLLRFKGYRKQSEWRNADVELPPNDNPVLCWYEYFRFGSYNRMYQTYGIGYCFKNGIWGGEVSNGQKTRVIAWMPLPEPPKGD